MSLNDLHVRLFVNAVEAMSLEVESGVPATIDRDVFLDPLSKIKLNAATLVTEICKQYDFGTVIVPEGWFESHPSASPQVSPMLRSRGIEVVTTTNTAPDSKKTGILTCPVCNNMISLEASKME